MAPMNRSRWKTTIKRLTPFLDGVIDRFKNFLFKGQKDFVFANARNILIIRLDRVGDLVLSIPAIKSLRASFPKAKLTLLVNTYTRNLIDGASFLDEVIAYSPDSKLGEKLRLIKEIRRQNYDLVIDLIYSRKLLSAVIALLSGATIKVGFDTGIRRFFFNRKVMPRSGKRYEMDRNLEIVEFLGCKSVTRNLGLNGIRRDEKILGEFCREYNIGSSTLLVGIHPSAYKNVLNRSWPKENFARLGDELFYRYGARSMITGGPEDVKLGEKIQRLMKTKAILLANKLTLSQLCALSTRFDLFISTFTGPLHIAVASGALTIILSGPTPVKRWAPQGNGHIVIQKDLPCVPCQDRTYCERGDYACMRKISVEEVLRAVEVQMRRLTKRED